MSNSRIFMNKTDWKIIKPVIKFNSNHDEKGQFASGSGLSELSNKQKSVIIAWTSLGNKSLWRQIANDLSEGKKPDASANDIETVKTLVEAIKENGIAPHKALGRAELLTTGLRWKGAFPKVGEIVKNELSSATINEKISESFSQYSDFSGGKSKPLVFHYGMETKGLSVNRVGADDFGNENEWLISGTFRVTDKYSENGITHINLKPIDSVQKFNPNHDEKGQFSSGSGGVASGSPKLTVMGKNDGSNEFFNERTRVVRFQPKGKAPIDYVLYIDGLYGDTVYAIKKPIDGTTIDGWGTKSRGMVGYLDVTRMQGNPWRVNSEDGKSTIVEVSVLKSHQRRGLASAMLKFHRDMFPEQDLQHSDALLPDGQAWASVVKFNPNHDDKGRFASGNNSIATESLSRVGGKKLNYDWYVQEGSNSKTRDAEVLGQLIHEQGWDKPSLSASAAEFEKLAGSGDFVRLYRGAPAEALQGLLDGKPWIGNGKAGAGTYVATSKERAQLFAGGGTVHEFLMPKKMFDNAMTARQVRKFYSKKTKQLGVPEQEWDDAGKFALSAHSGNGLLYAFDGDKEGTAYSNFASDYVVYNTSALIVKVNK